MDDGVGRKIPHLLADKAEVAAIAFDKLGRAVADATENLDALTLVWIASRRERSQT
jgi:hypothetical protein